jgi:putative addiction module component (TIGR02574 family)
MALYEVVLSEALALSAAEREALAAQLCESLSDEDYEFDAEVIAEAKRRIADYEQGKSEPIPWPVARKIIFGNS